MESVGCDIKLRRPSSIIGWWWALEVPQWCIFHKEWTIGNNTHLIQIQNSCLNVTIITNILAEIPYLGHCMINEALLSTSSHLLHTNKLIYIPRHLILFMSNSITHSKFYHRVPCEKISSSNDVQNAQAGQKSLSPELVSVILFKHWLLDSMFSNFNLRFSIL